MLSRSVSAEGRSRAFACGPRSRCPCSRCWPTTWWRCTDSRIISSCSSPGGSGTRLTGSPDPSWLLLSDYRRVFNRHRAVRDELESLTQAERERAAEAETLRFGLAEIETVAPVAGEDVALLAEEEKLANADALHAAATTAHEALLGDPASASVDGSDAVTLLGAAGHALEAVRAHDPLLAGLADRLTEASYLISDVAGELASYTDHWNPTRPGWPRCRNAGRRSAG